MMTLRYTPEAIRDISSLSDYIRDKLDNPTAAIRIKKSVLDTCSLLKTQPLMGGSAAEKLGYDTNLRYFVCEKQYIFYLVGTNEVSIVRVISASQDVIRILFRET